MELDPVDEFDESKPFYQQVLLIDTTIKDIQSVRIRHDTIGDNVDVFRGFRTIPYSGDAHQHVYPNGEVYDQVPSFYASVANTASMYSTSNKSDIIGEAHPGLSSDTRFGVLVPNQNQPQGRGGSTYQRHDRPDRQHGRGNYQGDRGGYAQHLNRRGRRDMQFGRGQGRIGNGRGDSRAGGHHFEGHNQYNGHREGQNGYFNPQEPAHGIVHHLDELSLDQHREGGYGIEQNRDDFALARHRDNLAMSQHRANLARRYDAISDDGVRTWGERYAEAPIFNAQHAPATGGVFYSAENIRRYGEPPFQEPPVYDGFNEENPYIPPPHLWDFTPGTTAWQERLQVLPGDLNPSGLHTYMAPGIANNVPQYSWPYMHGPARENNAGDPPPYFVPGPLEHMMVNHVDGHHSQCPLSGHDAGVMDAIGPDHGRMITGPRPRVVLPPGTPGERTLETDFGEGQGFLHGNLQSQTPLGPSPGRSPARTTTDEGSPLVRPRRIATDPSNQRTPIGHGHGRGNSGSDLRRWATAHSGFAIAQPRSSPSTGAFSPGPGSPGHGHITSTTARSSPGITFANSGPFGRSIARTASSHELNYVDFSINGETPGQVSRTPTPPINSGRRCFETRQYVPDGSRMSSPGQGSPVYHNGVFTEHRSEDGQM
ncbi:hypothetical protein EYC80_006620 [Monilinia laxa]|uniref:Uncharacterized protein n=1 Tax=Monilinia laxa TaxID=61186 RepID=A0A5N6JSH9_MONLA|nr:hypothetical protein EYC80_006620 [Monilinia laxa]